MTTTRHAYGIRRTVLYVVSCVLLTQHNQEMWVGSGDEATPGAALVYVKCGYTVCQFSHDSEVTPPREWAWQLVGAAVNENAVKGSKVHSAVIDR